MDTVTVKKEKLLKTLKKNKKEHRAIFEEAIAAYRKKVIKLLDQRLASIKKGEKINLAFGLPEPRDFTSSYDTAIEMLEWEIADEVELDKRDFEQLVLNKWAWMNEFVGTTQVYLAE